MHCRGITKTAVYVSHPPSPFNKAAAGHREAELYRHTGREQVTWQSNIIFHRSMARLTPSHNKEWVFQVKYTTMQSPVSCSVQVTTVSESSVSKLKFSSQQLYPSVGRVQ